MHPTHYDTLMSTLHHGSSAGPWGGLPCLRAAPLVPTGWPSRNPNGSLRHWSARAEDPRTNSNACSPCRLVSPPPLTVRCKFSWCLEGCIWEATKMGWLISLMWTGVGATKACESSPLCVELETQPCSEGAGRLPWYLHPLRFCYLMVLGFMSLSALL